MYCSLGLVTLCPLHYKAKGTNQVQGDMGPVIHTYCRVLTVPFGKQESIQLLSLCLSLPPSPPSNDNTSSVNRRHCSRQASGYFPFLFQSFWEIILCWCLPSQDAAYVSKKWTPKKQILQWEHNPITLVSPWRSYPTSLSYSYGYPIVPRLRPTPPK